MKLALPTVSIHVLAVAAVLLHTLFKHFLRVHPWLQGGLLAAPAIGCRLRGLTRRTENDDL